MVLANREDTVNTNITLTVREVAPEVPLVAVASAEASIDVLELSGATHVLPLKRWLGEHLANRATASHAQSHVVGRYRDLLIAELPVRHTPLAGKTIRDTRLRETTGLSIIAVWERGRLHPARPDLRLTDASVPVLTGTAEQLDELDGLLFIYDMNPNPILIIGGGGVGRAAARALRQKETPVRIIERDPALRERAAAVCDRVIEGEASDYEVLVRAGLLEAPSVVLTTHDDAMNIFLASYCRRLNPELRIVSRISHERNIESIHRAGADFVLSYATLGVASVLALLHGKELVVLEEGFDLFTHPLPPSLGGKTLAESGIGAQTGLVVLGIQQQDGTFVGNPPAATVLPPGADLVLLGDPDQRQLFATLYP
jgi:Trk K+ transport system NAD-binding subunit